LAGGDEMAAGAAGASAGGGASDSGTDYSGSLGLVAIGAVLCTVGGAVGSRLRRST
jgi:hypothetical protein